MEFIKKVLALVLVLFPILFFMQWWVGVFACLLIGFFLPSKKVSFFLSGLSLSSCWGIILIYNMLNGGEIIMERVSVMLNLNSPILLGLVILILPFILGGFAGLSGNLVKESLD
tara:strand:- start:2622 stop:2963 length:342 start_codon:yes stop_codon:yes gene_type:complete